MKRLEMCHKEPYYPIKIVIGTCAIVLFWYSASSDLFSSKTLRDVVSKYALKRSINACFSVVAAEIKSPWFKVTSDPGAGTFPSSSLKYARITNLDNTNKIALTISGSTTSFTQEVLPQSSIFVISSNVTSSNFNGTFGNDINFIQAYAIGGNIDVEYTLVNS